MLTKFVKVEMLLFRISFTSSVKWGDRRGQDYL